MLQDEATGAVGLAAEFADPGADVHVIIGALIQQLADPGQVLGVTTHMGADECRLLDGESPGSARPSMIDWKEG